MDQSIRQISSLLQDISWEFGSRRFDTDACGNLTYVEYMTLKQIAHCTEIPALALATRMGITKGGMSKIINRLEQKGYVRRERNKNDGRVCCVVPNREAKTILKQCEQHYSETLSHLLQEADSHQIDMLRSALHYVSEQLEREQQKAPKCNCTQTTSRI